MRFSLRGFLGMVLFGAASAIQLHHETVSGAEMIAATQGEVKRGIDYNDEFMLVFDIDSLTQKGQRNGWDGVIDIQEGDDTSLIETSETVPNRWVQVHNKYRCMHGSPNLAWSEPVAASAQEWADRLAATNEFKHSNCYQLRPPAGPAGENLAMGHRDLEQVVKSWYSEVKDCDSLPGCEKSTGGAVGHFTAVVWKGVKELGCGINGRVYVCRYKAGDRLSGDTPNMRGSYKNNVLPLSKTEAQCMAGSGTAPSTTPPRAATPEPATPSADCRDLRTSCASWKSKGYCTGKYGAWMSLNCMDSCGACTGASTPPPSAPPTPPPSAPPSLPPKPVPSPSDVVDDEDDACADTSPTGIKFRSGAQAECNQLSRYCTYDFVKSKCLKTCKACEGATPPPPPPSSGGADPTCGGKKKFVAQCGNCATSVQCQSGMFCCPYMKRCVPSSSTPCGYGTKGWAQCIPTCHSVECSTCKNDKYPGDWVDCAA